MFHNSWCNYAIKFNSHITCLDLRNQKFGVSENWIITILSDQIKYMNNPRRFWNSEVAEVPIDLQRERKRERAKARSSDWDRITILRSRVTILRWSKLRFEIDLWGNGVAILWWSDLWGSNSEINLWEKASRFKPFVRKKWLWD